MQCINKCSGVSSSLLTYKASTQGDGKKAIGAGKSLVFAERYPMKCRMISYGERDMLFMVVFKTSSCGLFAMRYPM